MVWKFVGYLGKTEAEILGCECDDEPEREEQMIEAWFCEGKSSRQSRTFSTAKPSAVLRGFAVQIDDTMFGGSCRRRARDASVRFMRSGMRCSIT